MFVVRLSDECRTFGKIQHNATTYEAESKQVYHHNMFNVCRSDGMRYVC